MHLIMCTHIAQMDQFFCAARLAKNHLSINRDIATGTNNDQVLRRRFRSRKSDPILTKFWRPRTSWSSKAIQHRSGAWRLPSSGELTPCSHDGCTNDLDLHRLPKSELMLRDADLRPFGW